MSEGIYTAETGLTAFEAGLQQISNDTANLNTPGFKSSTLLFADLVGGSGEEGLSGNGEGVATLGTSINFTPGQLESTGNPLDLALSGNGFFTLRDAQGNLHYTQDGQFKFNSAGILVSETTGEDVMAMSSSGALVPINITALQTSPAQATSTVTFNGNILTSAPNDMVSNITVIDKTGTSHSLTLTLTPVAGMSGSFTATLMDGTNTVGTGTIAFDGSGQPVAGQDMLNVMYTPPGGTAQPLELDFSNNVTATATGTASTLAVASQNGFASGTLTGETFDSTGTLMLTYSNNQTVKGGQLALANFVSPEELQSVSANEFAAKAGQAVQMGVAGSGAFGSVSAGMIEGSNVDLSQEFSNLVVLQRGYQACSQVISTASDMLSSLFDVTQQR
jgi:flagellar hook protein FlgE